MTEADKIKAFFTDDRRKLISVNAVEIMAGIPSSALKHFLDDRRSLPPAHTEAIIKVIELVGYNSK